MVQTLKDLALRFKAERKTKFIVGIIVLFAVVWFIAPEPQTRQRQAASNAQKAQPSTGTIAQQEAYSDVVERFRRDLESNQSENKELKTELSKQRQALDEYQQRTADIFKKMLEKMADQNGGGGIQTASSAPPPGPVDVTDGSQSQLEPISGPQELDTFGMDQGDIAPPPLPEPPKEAFVGAGDSVRVKLLAGVNAPTDGTPYPVVFSLISDVYGPDGSALPLGEARLIAAAQGSLTDSRALFRLTSMNVRLPDGRRVVKRVDGWIVGEDGIRGMPGSLIDPLGKAIAGAGLAGLIQGLGQGLEYGNSTTTVNDGGFLGLSTSTTVTGSPYEYAAGRGVRAMGSEWAGIIKDRLSEMVPVVQVLSGREGTAVFARSLSIKGLFQQIASEEESDGSLY